MDETGCGIRLPTYTFSEDAMSDAIDRLLADRPLAERLEAMSRRLRASPGNERAAELIARVAETGEPVTG